MKVNKRLFYTAYTLLLIGVVVVSVLVHLTSPQAVTPYAIGIGIGFVAGGLTVIAVMIDQP